jgi:hypothetical protein
MQRKKTQQNNTQRCQRRVEPVNTKKHPAQIDYLVEQIVATCRDEGSRGYYARVAAALPDEHIFRFLAEIRQDASIRNRGAVFVAKVKRYRAEQP